jgi:two-component system, NtrC family, sensor histidine kinase KinB
MKTSIRNTRFTMGMVLFLVIILLLSISSAYYLNRLSRKTNAILKENHYSVVYARDMSEDLVKINQEIVSCFLTNKNLNSLLIYKELNLFDKSLQLEKNNITEVGEGKLVSSIEIGFKEYRDCVVLYIKSPKQAPMAIFLQNKFGNLTQLLMLLSQINENAIELKTDDAKVSAKKATIQMSFIAALCFLIAYGFTFSFSSYFNDRFYQLYNGIKEMVSSNYDSKLHFNGKDEIYEISLVFNEMAAKLHEHKQKIDLTLQDDLEKEPDVNDVQELKSILFRLKNMEEQALDLISRLENKNE